MSGRAWIDVLVSRPPVAPHEHALEAQRGALAELGTETYATSRLDWSKARSVFSSAQRRGRAFSSSKRRFLMDTLTFLVRQEATFAQVLEEAGLPADSSRARVERARYLAALVLFGGLPPSAVEWPGGQIDWEGVADPRHCLETWLRRAAPSPAAQLATFGSIPLWLAERLLDRKDPPGLVAALNRRGPLCLRANRPFASRASLLAEITGASPCRLARDGIELPWHMDARSLPALAEGRADIQDEGSQLIVELAAPQEGERIIDACAGALGKSLALASMQEDGGTIVATDPRKDALRRGMKRARRAGYKSIRTVPQSQVGAPAQLVVVDAPCTGTGALRRRPWTRWSTHVADLERLRREQLGILTRCSSWVSEGGRLLYATCSLLREENEEVVEGFLKENPQWRLQPASEILGEDRADEIGEAGVLRLYPHLHGTDGFYAAVLTRS